MAGALLGLGIIVAENAIPGERFLGPSSRVLGRALEAAGFARPLNAAAHHIVAGAAPLAADARAVLERFGIGINDAANGVFLPSVVHSSLHTNAYYTGVNDALAGATNSDEALEVLEGIRSNLLGGGFP